MDTRIVLDYMEKREFLTLPKIELQTLCSVAHSQLLYRRHYSGDELSPVPSFCLQFQSFVLQFLAALSSPLDNFQYLVLGGLISRL